MDGCTLNSAWLSFVTPSVSAWPVSNGPGLAFVSAPPIVCGPASSAAVLLAMRLNVGASFTGVTVIVNVCAGLVSTPPLAVPPLSVSLSVIVADPFAFGAGVNVRAPLALTAGPAAKSAGFELPVRTNASVCPASSAGPALMPVAQLATDCAPASSSTVWSGPLVKLGAWLTGLTVMPTVAAALELSIPSLAL